MAPKHHINGHAPNLESYFNSKLHLEASVETAVTLLKRRQIHGPEQCALATAHILSQVVVKSKWADVDQLLDRVYQVGRKLVDAQPQELVIGNIIRRVLGLIRDEAEEDRNENANETGGDFVPDLRTAATTAAATSLSFSASPTSAHAPISSSLPRPSRQASLVPASGSYQSMFNLLSAAEPSPSVGGDASSTVSGASTPVHLASGQGHGSAVNFAGRHSALRDEIVDGIEEIKDEIGQADDQIAGFAEGQIKPGDFVMVYAPSRSVEKFLVKAALRRRYTLFLVNDNSPTHSSTGLQAVGERYASLLKRLSAAKVNVIRVANNAVASYIPRTSKIVLDARAIAADGGVLVDSGGGRVARAAHAQGCTVLVVGGVYKVSPESWTDPDAFVEWGDPGRLARFADGAILDGIKIESAMTEYLPPGLIDIYVTNLGPHSKHYLESVIADHYKNEDLELYGQ
ncbi:translation regulator gcd7 [Grosmannia clavigera kw1407]|uniref:Translation initiation factor eIF2B subunit beta n=1 Tax=Grosmannia clavigera (strain kw1407 / UAMH 11150) TaxID=655863 RepID=F0XRV1_GROCL|nr:translation regulator gcd7 [Grosmannia clavigera kw1407]EFW99473.1 translation regulator gcd7 [Grosmannia clavigera kw1407]